MFLAASKLVGLILKNNAQAKSNPVKLQLIFSHFVFFFC